MEKIMACGQSLPMIVVRGTNYEVGYQIGTTFKSLIQAPVNMKLVEKLDTPKGNNMYSSYLKVVQDVYPHYVDELKGIAEGSGVPFKYLLLKLLTPEINAISGKPPRGHVPLADGCTDLILNSPEQALITHSEDVSPEMVNGYLVKAHILPSDSNPREEKFLAYSDPGMLPGNTFNVNSHGVVTTCNMMFQKGVTSTNAIIRKFVTRALLSAESLDDAISILKRPPGTGSAFNINIAVKGKDGEKPEMYSLENGHGPDGPLVHVHKYGEGLSYHFNAVRRLNIDHYVDNSSRHRVARLKEFPHPNDMKDLLEIMSDRKDEDFPIYRNGAHPDPFATASIGAFDLVNDVLYVYKGNPKDCEYHASAVFNIRNHIEELFGSFNL